MQTRTLLLSGLLVLGAVALVPTSTGTGHQSPTLTLYAHTDAVSPLSNADAAADLATPYLSEDVPSGPPVAAATFPVFSAAPMAQDQPVWFHPGGLDLTNVDLEVTWYAAAASGAYSFIETTLDGQPSPQPGPAPWHVELWFDDGDGTWTPDDPKVHQYVEAQAVVAFSEFSAEFSDFTSPLPNAPFALAIHQEPISAGTSAVIFNDPQFPTRLNITRTSVNTAPVATLAADATSGPAPLQVAFDLNGNDAETAAADLEWAFDADDDGSPEFTSDDGALPFTAVHTYAHAGSFTARLTVTDASGASASDIVQVLTTLAADAGGPYTGLAGDAITVSATHSGGSGAGCAWSGAGAVFADVQACDTTVTFEGAGSYALHVTVTAGGDSATDTATVLVDDDTDGDGAWDGNDNCPSIANADQADLDKDGVGDACDGDRDGDGAANADDTCPAVSDPGQADLDKDGVGDACDDDTDGDGAGDTADNCARVANAGQADQDLDGVGDACDADVEGDGVVDSGDNCPGIANAGQADQDLDGVGDACDGDRDGDGSSNGIDNCPGIANADQADQDLDGIGDACDDDTDGDGVVDAQDAFPLNGNQTKLGQDIELQDVEVEPEDKETPGLGIVGLLAVALLVALVRRR